MNELHNHLMSDGQIAMLESLAFNYRTYAKETELSREVLKDLMQKVIDLMEDIDNSSIDDEIKSILLKILARMHTSLTEYFIDGAEGIADAMMYSYGLFFSQVSEGVAKSEKSFFQSTREKIVAVFALLAIISSTIDIKNNFTEEVPKFLEYTEKTIESLTLDVSQQAQVDPSVKNP